MELWVIQHKDLVSHRQAYFVDQGSPNHNVCSNMAGTTNIILIKDI
jgi:hypothetical protein